MNKLSLLFESPPWLIGIGVIIGAVYAAILYYHVKTPWSRNTNYILAAIRFLMVTQLTLLLFGPLIRQVKNTKEQPTVILAIDNSISVEEVEDSVSLDKIQNFINTLKQDLVDNEYIIEVRTLSSNDVDEGITFDANSSDINRLLSGIQNDYESRNLSEVILVTDGLYNLGNNPAFHPYNFRISTVGLGDTLQKPDINLNSILYNKIAYEGNKFPIAAELFCYNLAGKTITVQLEKGSDILERKQIKVNKFNQFDQVEFLTEANESGMQRYRIRVLPIDGEFSLSNNSKEAYIDVISGKQKILLAAAAPHPDIKAIKSALEENQNYELVTFIQGINQFKEDKYDAMIFHQVPDRRRKYQQLLQKVVDEKIPSFFVYGSQSDVNKFNEINGAVQVVPINYQKDNVFPFYNDGFGKFIYNNDNVASLNEFTPVSVPFANYKVNTQSEVMLYQKVGKVTTQKPLLLIQKSNGWSSAVMLGEGMWNWRIQEFAKNQNYEAFDEMISKIIQFLSTKEDKRRFKVYPIKNEYLNSETVVFETEVYNDIYEKTYGHKIDLRIKNDDNSSSSYNYVTSEQNSSYNISGLENGIYTYSASAVINGNTDVSSGSFTVQDLQIETTNLTADHNLLRNIARLNNGKFYHKDEMEALKDDILSEEKVFKIYSSENYLAIINMKWGFFILILFVTAEWFLRKFHGSY